MDLYLLIFVAPFFLNVNVTLQHLNWFKRIRACPAIVREFLTATRVVLEDMMTCTSAGH